MGFNTIGIEIHVHVRLNAINELIHYIKIYENALCH